MQADPGWHHPVELRQRDLQRIEGRGFPVGEERSGERTARLRRSVDAARAAFFGKFFEPMLARALGARFSARAAVANWSADFKRPGATALFSSSGAWMRRDPARPVGRGSLRHGHKAVDEACAQQNADRRGNPADDGKTCRAFAAGVEKDRLVCHDALNRLCRMLHSLF